MPLHPTHTRTTKPAIGAVVGACCSYSSPTRIHAVRQPWISPSPSRPARMNEALPRNPRSLAPSDLQPIATPSGSRWPQDNFSKPRGLNAIVQGMQIDSNVESLDTTPLPLFSNQNVPPRTAVKRSHPQWLTIQLKIHPWSRARWSHEGHPTAPWSRASPALFARRRVGCPLAKTLVEQSVRRPP